MGSQGFKQISAVASQNSTTKYLAQQHQQKCRAQYLIKIYFLSMLNSFLSKVNASVKVKVRGGCVPPDSGGMKSCVAVCAPQSVRGTSPSTPTPACVSAERVHSRVCGRAGSSTTTPAGRRSQQKGQDRAKVSTSKTLNSSLILYIIGTFIK